MRVHRILALATLLAAVPGTACGGDGGGGAGQAGPSNAAPAGSGTPGGTAARFVIDALPLDLSGDPWAWPADAGSWPASQFNPIHIFGREYQGKVESTLMFDMVKVGQPVLAPITGRVVDVRQQPESCDVELYIGSEATQQVVSLDHITTTLTRGATVTAGQQVGTVPKWSCKEPFGRFELMVVKELDGKVQALCPMDLVSDAARAQAAVSFKKVMEDWNRFVDGKSTSTYSAAEIGGAFCASPTAPA